MHKLGLFVAVVALVLSALAPVSWAQRRVHAHPACPCDSPPALTSPSPGAASPAAGRESTDRKVHGVITSIEPAKLTIASQQRAVTGRIDPARTKVTVGGKPGRLADLKLTDHARGELCLDDVWLVIDSH